jgi:hypothetical protein
MDRDPVYGAPRIHQIHAELTDPDGGRRTAPTTALVRDEPVIVHCYTTPADIQEAGNLADLGAFCRRMGREANQGEVGLVIGDEYFAIRDFAGAPGDRAPRRWLSPGV